MSGRGCETGGDWRGQTRPDPMSDAATADPDGAGERLYKGCRDHGAPVDIRPPKDKQLFPNYAILMINSRNTKCLNGYR